MKKIRICAGIVTYNPDIELLIKNINAISDQVNKVIIVDNGSINWNNWSNRILSKNVEIIRNRNNDGIAKALNQICTYAVENDYDYVLTLDQDSIAPLDLVEQLSVHMSKDTAIVAPNIVYRNNENYADNITKGCEEVEWVITSASLTNLSVWKELSGFDERLFIDGVDRDFCIRARRNNYKIIKNYNVCLNHELGDLKCKKKFGRIVYVTNHSSIRKYYMARNSIYLDYKLGLKTSKYYLGKLVLKTLLYESNKIKKLSAIMKGIYDGNKMKEKIK